MRPWQTRSVINRGTAGRLFPEHDLPGEDPSPEVVAAYERTVLALLREWADSPEGAQTTREISSVHLRGRYPDTELVIRYYDVARKEEHTARWGVWYGPDELGRRKQDSPAAAVGNFIHLWDAREIDPVD